MASVSVIIPCFNAKAWIGEALRSVLAQGIDDTEILVVDDGSTDGSSDIIKREFPFVSLLKTDHEGPSRARNIGTKIARGEYIQYLDADDLLAPGKVKIQLAALINSGADVAYGDWQRLVPNRDGVFEEGEKIVRQLQNPEIDLFTGERWCNINAYLFNRKIIEKINGWNERLLFIQDARFVLDCALYGARFIYCPGLMGYYRIHSSDSVSTRDRKGYIRDFFINATEVEDWWKDHHGVITEERLAALIKVYGNVARAAFESDKATFEDACLALERLKPGYAPEGPAPLKLASKIFGYRKAEEIAFWYRRFKKVLI